MLYCNLKSISLLHIAMRTKDNYPNDLARLDSSWHIYPPSAQLIAEYQRTEKVLWKNLKDDWHSKFFLKSIEGSDLILMEGKIYIPKPLWKQIIKRHHKSLCYPGKEQTEQTICQNLPKDVEQFVNSCHDCQVSKSSGKKYGHLPVSDEEEKPWHPLCVDLIGPNTITTATNQELSLLAMTMTEVQWMWPLVKYSIAMCLGNMLNSSHCTRCHTRADNIWMRYDFWYGIPNTLGWITAGKKEARERNNIWENSKRVKYTYQVGDHVLLNHGFLQRKLSSKCNGPYQVTRVYSNGTIHITKGIISEIVSI